MQPHRKTIRMLRQRYVMINRHTVLFRYLVLERNLSLSIRILNGSSWALENAKSKRNFGRTHSAADEGEELQNLQQKSPQQPTKEQLI